MPGLIFSATSISMHLSCERSQEGRRHKGANVLAVSAQSNGQRTHARSCATHPPQHTHTPRHTLTFCLDRPRFTSGPRSTFCCEHLSHIQAPTTRPRPGQTASAMIPGGPRHPAVWGHWVTCHHRQSDQPPPLSPFRARPRSSPRARAQTRTPCTWRRRNALPGPAATRRGGEVGEARDGGASAARVRRARE